jgi:hypothetical protein
MSAVNEDDAPAEGENDLVEVARAHDRLESTIWARNLEEQGIEVRTESKGTWLRALLYLGRVPVAVYVPRKDYARAREYLEKYRFI